MTERTYKKDMDVINVVSKKLLQKRSVFFKSLKKKCRITNCLFMRSGFGKKFPGKQN